MIVNSVQAVADFLRKSPRTVQRYIRAGLPVLPGRKYDLQAVSAWLANGKKRGSQAERREVMGKIFEATVTIRRGLNEIADALSLAAGLPPDEIKKIVLEALDGFLREENHG